MRLPYVRSRRLTRVEYEALVERAVLDENDPIELLDGRLYFRGETRGTPHMAASLRTRLALDGALRRDHHVRSRYPIDNGVMSAPDVVVLRGPIDDSRDAPPPPAVLVVEIADTTLTTDRGRKGGFYARAGVPDYWIVNLVDRVLEVHREPVRSPSGRWKYRSVSLLRPGDVVSPLAAPRARIRVADLLP